MRIAVVGGTGAVGRHVVTALERDGHEAVVVSRSRGADVFTGEGLDAALHAAQAVVDVTSLEAADVDAVRTFFATGTRNLLAAEARAGVRHHVLLSIVGLDRIEGNAHHAGKKAQEELVRAGAIPWTILRAAQFHEFAGMVVDWMRVGDAARVPPILIQPVAADVGDVLAEIAAGPPLRRIVDLVGPQVEDLFDMARRTVAARAEKVRLVPSWRDTIYGPEAAGEVLLPPSDARIAPTSFDDWLARTPRRR
jgi:uncharacterized protein YbjT (DUF2867 family)